MATGNQRVRNDVCAKLGDNITVFRGELSRESLHLQTIDFPRRSHRLAWLADILPHLDGTGIIYTATTRDADQVAQWLKSRGLNVEAYYGSLKGLNRDENRTRRMQLEQALLDNNLKALVATSALGMGYDKPDLSFVIHYQSPGSVVSYYQQVGRAGRAIPDAYGVLLSGNEDDDIQNYFIQQAFPQEWLVEQILEALERADDGLARKEILNTVNGSDKKAEAALKFLSAESPAPIMISQQRPIKYSRTLINYELPHEAIARLSQLKEGEWKVMQDYLHHDGCLMQFLSNELDDSHASPCGRCANCDPKKVLSVEFSHETGLAATEFLANVFIEIAPRKQVDVLNFPFDQLPRNLASEDLLFETGRALCRWGEAGWGEIAKAGKEAGKFDARLVKAAAKMITERWNPDPYPVWIAFVPSQNNPNLVADFAEELAEKLGLPCMDIVVKMKKNNPQKHMQNSHFRCINLDGVFQIKADVPDRPMFLIDDAVDSRWTFTVIAALLRRAGSGSVYPFAVMATASNA